ncbi:MAG TPA: hypothetical protein VGO78_04470 [Acidimicrobiales bacterium]|nr:hypothetical protein [Acidimicrobiales bacterium]
MDPRTRQNQVAWDVAATKYVVETDALLAEARAERALLPEERDLLGPVLTAAPRVVHLQSGHGRGPVLRIMAHASTAR